MAFEKFTSKGRGYKPQVSIWNRGQIGFNRGALNICKLKEHTNVVFFYDVEKKRIGFKFTNNAAEEGAFKLKMYDTGAIVSAKAFLEYYQINYEVTRKYDLTFDKESELFYIDISKEVPKKGDSDKIIKEKRNYPPKEETRTTVPL